MTEKIEKSRNGEVDPHVTHPQDHISYTLTLCERGAKGELEAHFIAGFDPQDPRICAADTRASVLYPLDCNIFRFPDADHFSIGFLAPRRPLEFLSDLNTHQRRLALFGCGICSVVLVATDQSEIDLLITREAENLYAWERWEIDGAKVIAFEDDWGKQHPGQLKQIKLCIGPGHNDATAWLINELFLNLNRFYQNAQRYAPFAVSETETLANDVDELIQEILEDEEAQRQAHKSPSLSDSSLAVDERLNFLRAKRRLNANLDLLVQLNSALVYAVSQAFAGAIPIRQRFPHISQHSLLGTGTAWRAIHRTCSCIFGTFRAEQFPEKMREKLEATPAGGASAVDDPEQVLSELRLNTRIVHFSARSGFGESDAAITCPSQTIQVCDQPEWSLCTATHEILHAHVRELIAAVFCEPLSDETPKPFDESLATAVQKYEEHIKKQTRAISKPVSALDELRHGLIEFALEYRANIVKAKSKFWINQTDFDSDDAIEVVVTLPKNNEAIFRAFKKSFRLLEETIVHILDLHYFFAGDLELFSDSIWHSWSIVPSVLEKLDWYILRTLLAVASKSVGDPFERLDEAARILSDSLNKVIRRQRGAIIATEVLRKLNSVVIPEGGERHSSPFAKWLDLLFPACLPLVDLTKKFFVSRPLVSIFASHNGDLLDEQGHYPIDLPDFDIRGVANPIALIHDRLKIGLDQEGIRPLTSEETARRSAWLLLALSSELK